MKRGALLVLTILPISAAIAAWGNCELYSDCINHNEDGTHTIKWSDGTEETLSAGYTKDDTHRIVYDAGGC